MSISGGCCFTPFSGRAATTATTHLFLNESSDGESATMVPVLNRLEYSQTIFFPDLMVENCIRVATPCCAKVIPTMCTYSQQIRRPSTET